MADPFSIGFSTILGGLGMGSSLLGGIVGAKGAQLQGQAALFQGEAQAQQYMYQAGMAEYNSKLALENADYTRNAGEVEAQRLGLRGRDVIGKTIAGRGASGLDIGSGSSADVIDSERMIVGQEQAVSRANTARAAYGSEVEAYQQTQQAGMYKKSAANARIAAKYGKTAADYGVATSILGGATSVSSKWLEGRQKGLF